MLEAGPKDALICINGSYYKYGLRGMIFIHDTNDGWFRSTKGEANLMAYWKKEFESLFKLPAEIGKEEKKALKEEHKANMAPYILNGSWKHKSPECVFNEVYPAVVEPEPEGEASGL